MTNDAGRGAHFDLRAVPLEEIGTGAQGNLVQRKQERYVLAIAPESLELFKLSANASACPFCGGGAVATQERRFLWVMNPLPSRRTAG